ncbi:hypothetical protein [Emticicia fluvialis]|uniref:hypothetical protein n=1 Tax=Emticicia fluvialis TaxID=2974474 RepID=UPI0021654A83|nr:hypothetical protein [Emticicia fluvialis]
MIRHDIKNDSILLRLDMLKSHAIINDDSNKIRQLLGNNLPPYVREKKTWTKVNYALFKTEDGQVNVGIRKGELLKEFNRRIDEFELVK